MTRARPDRLPIQQRGSTLIEVLVALLVLGVGLGGLAVSQTQALTSARATHFHLQAALLTEEVAELARAYAPGAVPIEQREAWRKRVAARLPDPSIALSLPVGFESGQVTLSWSDQQVHRPFHP
jgi:type IV pilus assembly protein PilV